MVSFCMFYLYYMRKEESGERRGRTLEKSGEVRNGFRKERMLDG